MYRFFVVHFSSSRGTPMIMALFSNRWIKKLKLATSDFCLSRGSITCAWRSSYMVTKVWLITDCLIERRIDCLTELLSESFSDWILDWDPTASIIWHEATYALIGSQCGKGGLVIYVQVQGEGGGEGEKGEGGGTGRGIALYPLA